MTRPALLVFFLGFGLPGVAQAAPSPARTARAMALSHDTLLLGGDPGAPRLPPAEAARFDEAVAAVRRARPGLLRGFADLALAGAERRWAGVVAETMAHASVCTIAESAAYRADVAHVAPWFGARLRDALWRWAIVAPEEPTLGELVTTDADFPRTLSPEGHAVLGRMVGLAQAGLDPKDELRLALAVPDPSPWTRVRYAEVLRHRGQAALAQARLAATEAEEPCVRLRALTSITQNREAPPSERAEALAQARTLVATLLTTHPGDAALTTLAEGLPRADAEPTEAPK